MPGFRKQMKKCKEKGGDGDTQPDTSAGHSTWISKASGLRTGIHTRRINRVDGTREAGDLVFGLDTPLCVYISPRIGPYVVSGTFCKTLKKLVSCKTQNCYLGHHCPQSLRQCLSGKCIKQTTTTKPNHFLGIFHGKGNTLL